MMSVEVKVQQLQSEFMNESVQEVFKKEGDKLFRFIRSRVPTNEDAEDIFQDVFYQLADAYVLAKDIRSGGAWIFRVARNKIIDFFRKHKTQRIEDFNRSYGNDDGDEISLYDIIPSSDRGPEFELLRGMVRDTIQETLNDMPASQREVFEMHEFEGISFKEMAEMTGKNENTLITRKRYVILKLRENLKSIYDEMFND